MKKSINGKTFDEIFGQRGNNANPKKMAKGVFYFCEADKGMKDLCVFNYESTFSGHVLFSIALAVFRNGVDKLFTLKAGENDNICRLCTSWAFFEATPDQIALLNSYKTESK